VEIARAGREFDADLLIIGARGEHETEGGRPGLGGTSLKLLGAASIPLRLVRTAGTESPRTVLAAVDMSPVSRDVLKWARASTGDGGRAFVFHAFEAPFAARLRAYGIAKESIDLYSGAEQAHRERALDAMIADTAGNGEMRSGIERGDPIDLLFAHVRRLEPDLIVLGKHGSRPRRRSAPGTGSVSRHVAFFSPTDLLIVPPSPARR
jgi:nucleotide-binding universal stress UspA family protein